MNRIGIVGTGFVGTAIKEGMRHAFEIVTYDKKYGEHVKVLDSAGILEYECWNHPLETTVKLTDGPIFVCVPTPMKKNGDADTSIVDSVVRELAIHCTKHKAGPIIIKSTVPPGTTERLMEETGVGIIFNPEFLTEDNSIEDFKNQTRIVIGGPKPDSTVVEEMYKKAYPDVLILNAGSTTTVEMVKYITNTFLATKLSFANEINQLCGALNINYDEVIDFATKDKRLGSSFWSVPGPDGKKGYGKTCLPKDLNALISLSKSLNIQCPTLEGGWKTNLIVRPEKDWEIKGRSTT